MRVTLTLIATMWGLACQADVPRVAVDIAPVHSLVAQVMEGAGAPELIMRPGASPHGYAMRPSEAAALSRADLVIWTGEALTPWLGAAIGKLAGDTPSVALLDFDETHLLPLRDGVAFGSDEHEHHDHHGIDPHAWLDLVNAQIWLRAIATELATLDRANAELYHANAARRAGELDLLFKELQGELDPLRDVKFVVFHDAYQYFEARFSITAAASISLGDAAQPGPSRIAALRDLVEDLGMTCVLSEPQFDPKIAGAILPDGYARGTLDPMGAEFTPGPELYPNLMKALVTGFSACKG